MCINNPSMCASERDEGKLDRDARKRRCHSVSISRFMPLPKKVSRDLFRSFFLFAFSPPPSKMKIDFFFVLLMEEWESYCACCEHVERVEKS